jgi:hypothetical protein
VPSPVPQRHLPRLPTSSRPDPTPEYTAKTSLTARFSGRLAPYPGGRMCPLFTREELFSEALGGQFARPSQKTRPSDTEANHNHMGTILGILC